VEVLLGVPALDVVPESPLGIEVLATEVAAVVAVGCHVVPYDSKRLGCWDGSRETRAGTTVRVGDDEPRPMGDTKESRDKKGRDEERRQREHALQEELEERAAAEEDREEQAEDAAERELADDT
jgi:hypothetical protein